MYAILKIFLLKLLWKWNWEQLI